MDSIRGDDVRHAVVIPLPTQGHVSPLLHLSQALASRGIVVTLINTEANQEAMKNISVGGGHGVDIRFETVPGIRATEIDFSSTEGRLVFIRGLHAMADSVEKLLTEKIIKRDPPVSCLISDMLFDWTAEVASRIGVPNLVFSCASASNSVLELSVPRMLEKGDIPARDRSISKSITYIPGLPPLPIWSLPCELSSEENDPGFTWRYNLVKHISDAPVLLVNSFQELEPDAFQALKQDANPNTIAVGPILLASGSNNVSLWKEDEESLRWLDEQQPESVLYISFGSIAAIEIEQFHEIAAALEELRKPFLWAVRPNSVPGMESEVLERFKGRVRGFGLVVSWAPQLEVLGHPSTGGHLSHCGWNSIMESVISGVPILCWPCVAEQNLNCKLVVEDWKIGLRFSRVVTGEVVMKSEFVQVMKQLMDDCGIGDRLRSNVKELSVVARGAAAAGGSSYENLEEFVKLLKKN